MKNYFLAAITLAGAALLCSCGQKPVTSDEPGLKPRLVVLTDIGPSNVEPDDNESAVRLLAYADRFEIELIATNVGWNCEPYPTHWIDYLYNVVDAYGKDLPNLAKRSGQTEFMTLEQENGKQELGYWPTMEYIRSRSMLGSEKGGIAALGEDNDSPGSEMLIKLADEDDDRPIYVCAWGGANTLSQAIWRVSQTRSEEEVKKFVSKFRIYTITDQDMSFPKRANLAYSSHQWLRRDFSNELLFVWDESAWMNQNGLGRQNWDLYAEKIQTKGEMGKTYPKFKFGVEGDTPSFLHVMPNGLNDPEDPSQVSWGGVHLWGITPDKETYAWTNWEEPLKSISNEYEHKFYPDEFNDFAARMQWADEGQGNVNPVVIIGEQGGIAPIEIEVAAGTEIKLSADKSYDPDGDKLNFQWWIQKFPGEEVVPVLEGADSAKLRVQIPENTSGKRYHLVCEVHDDGPFQLVAYRRILINVK